MPRNYQVFLKMLLTIALWSKILPITQYIRRSYERKAGAQRQFVESAVKQTEIKNSRLCTKIKKTLNQSRIIRKVSKDVNSDNESSWEDLDINGFEQSQQEQKSPINLRRKTSYL